MNNQHKITNTQLEIDIKLWLINRNDDFFHDKLYPSIRNYAAWVAYKYNIHKTDKYHGDINIAINDLIECGIRAWDKWKQNFGTSLQHFMVTYMITYARNAFGTRRCVKKKLFDGALDISTLYTDELSGNDLLSLTTNWDDSGEVWGEKKNDMLTILNWVKQHCDKVWPIESTTKKISIYIIDLILSNEINDIMLNGSKLEIIKHIKQQYKMKYNSANAIVNILIHYLVYVQKNQLHSKPVTTLPSAYSIYKNGNIAAEV